MQTVWLFESLVEERQAAIRREVAACRRRRPLPAAPWRVRLGWRLVEVGLRLALPSSPARGAATSVGATECRSPGW